MCWKVTIQIDRQIQVGIKCACTYVSVVVVIVLLIVVKKKVRPSQLVAMCIWMAVRARACMKADMFESISQGCMHPCMPFRHKSTAHDIRLYPLNLLSHTFKNHGQLGWQAGGKLLLLDIPAASLTKKCPIIRHLLKPCLF